MNILSPNISLTEVKELLKESPIYITNEIGESALHIQTDFNVLSFLLEMGADPNWKTVTMNTPLHYKRSPEIVKLFLHYGADPNSVNLYGNTPLHKQTDKESVTLLLEAGADKNIKNILKKSPRDVNIHLSRSNFIYYILFIVFLFILLMFTIKGKI